MKDGPQGLHVQGSLAAPPLSSEMGRGRPREGAEGGPLPPSTCSNWHFFNRLSFKVRYWDSGGRDELMLEAVESGTAA